MFASHPAQQHGAVIAAGVAGARLVVVPDAAHLANVEAPDLVTTALLDHLIDGAMLETCGWALGGVPSQGIQLKESS